MFNHLLEDDHKELQTKIGTSLMYYGLKHESEVLDIKLKDDMVDNINNEVVIKFPY